MLFCLQLLQLALQLAPCSAIKPYFPDHVKPRDRHGTRPLTVFCHICEPCRSAIQVDPLDDVNGARCLELEINLVSFLLRTYSGIPEDIAENAGLVGLRQG